MASPMTPKGRVHLRNGWRWESRRSASLATPKGRGAPSATATSWDPSTDPSLVLLVLGNRLSRRNRGRFLLCHREVVVVWPCPHALPSPALAAACGAFGSEPHPRNAPDLHTLPAPRGARVLPVGASVPTRAAPPGGGHARPLPRGGSGGGASRGEGGFLLLGVRLLSSGTQPPPPPSCPPGPLSCQGSIATGQTYGGAKGAQKIYFHSLCPRGTPPCPGTGAWMGGTSPLSLTCPLTSGANNLRWTHFCRATSRQGLTMTFLAVGDPSARARAFCT